MTFVRVKKENPIVILQWKMTKTSQRLQIHKGGMPMYHIGNARIYKDAVMQGYTFVQ